MKRCKGCNNLLPHTSFNNRKDSPDGLRNICKKFSSSGINIGRVVDETGKIYGKWLVLSRSQNKPDGSAVWLCRCSCGTEKEIPASTLRRNSSMSCGCNTKEYGKGRRKLSTIINTVIRSYKNGAKSRNLDFTLSEAEIKELIFSKCFYCGDIPSDKKYFYGRNTGKDLEFFIEINGIDRVDNTIGYIKDNVVTCCKICNQMKSNIPLKVFLDKVNNIHSKGVLWKED